jgi:hypothetical protein
MKTTFTRLFGAAVLLLTLNFQPSTAFAQGSLTPPPGPPGPTMLTLSQVEPRTPISSAPITITQSGSYYLTTNLNVSSGDAIDINAGDVTLDLNGFTISSTAPSATGNAVNISSRTNITIVNGHIRGGVTNNISGVFGGGGFGSGIYASGSAYNLRVSGVTVSGCLFYGIFLFTGYSTVIESCSVQNIGSYGLFADTISHSTAINVGDYAISGNTVSDCSASASGNGYGIYAKAAHNCYGQAVNGTGISAVTAENCYGTATGGGSEGISGNSVQNCYGTGGNIGIGADTVIGSYGAGAAFGINASTVVETSNGSSSSGTGIDCSSGPVNFSSGQTDSGYAGIYGYTVQSCYGYNGGSGYGIYTYDLASLSYGYSSSGTGLRAYIANSCDGTSLAVTFKYNMP